MASEKAREGNRRRNKKWRKANPEHVAELDRAKSLAHYHRNIEARRAGMRERAKARWAAMTAEERKEFKLLETYGITLQQWRDMLTSQGNKCAACGTDTPGQRGWQTDHCHTTKVVRGLLCTHCNTALGLLKEDPQKMLALSEYITRSKMRRP